MSSLPRVDVLEEVRRRGGVVRRSSLPRWWVEKALESGQLVAPRRGLVADPAMDAGVLLALSHGGVLSCCSAARALGLEVLGPVGSPHVTVPRTVSRPSASRASVQQVVVHRRDVPSLDGVTTLARTAADAARCLTPLPAVVVVDAVLRRGVGKASILAEARGRGSARARLLIERGSAGSGSSGETAARLALEDAGLAVEPQVFVRGVGWVDLLVEGRLVVEVDGFSYHSDPRQFAKDRRRDAALLGMGYRVVRFTWADAVNEPGYLVRSVEAALGRIGGVTT